jgi:hypothetical protein
LICIEDFGLAVTGKRLFDRSDAELGFQRDREPLGKDFRLNQSTNLLRPREAEEAIQATSAARLALSSLVR